MQPQVPDNSHDAVAWLQATLRDVKPCDLEPEVLEGFLPAELDFDRVDAQLKQLTGGLIESTRAQNRSIRFIPKNAGVYRSLNEMLNAQVSNQFSVPAKFTLLDIKYSHGQSKSIPEAVRGYLDAVIVCNLIKEISDFPTMGGRIVHLVLSAEKKLAVSLSYSSSDVTPLKGVNELSSQFLGTDTHPEEKRNICRKALFEVMKGRPESSVANVIEKFDEWLANIRASYAMFMEKFSSHSLSAEVEKQNSEDMLRLNKTFSEIQNQLLAIPAALLLAGAAIEAGKGAKNLSILVGSLIFIAMMWLLVRNQEHSVCAIDSEVNLRKAKLDEQPAEISDLYKEAFKNLEGRVRHQRSVLNVVRVMLAVVGLFVVAMVINAYVPGGLLPQLERFGRLALRL